MASIPKIKISAKRKREKCNLDFDCSTTANFGYVQPTMCREMIPNSKFEVQVATRVLLASMPVPTFGRMYLEHKHVFVPYVDVCPQFDSFIAGQPYRDTAGNMYYPELLPPFLINKVSQYVLSKWADCSFFKQDDDGIWQPLLLNEQNQSTEEFLEMKAAWDDILFNQSTGNQYVFNQRVSSAFMAAAKSLLPLGGDEPRGGSANREGKLFAGRYYISLSNGTDTDSYKFSFHNNTNPAGAIFPNETEDVDYISIENADFISQFGTNGQYLVTFRLLPVGKRIREILVGLGYQFNPNLEIKGNWLKLFAFYKSWFAAYRPKRGLSFNATSCYRLIKMLEQPYTNVENDIWNYMAGTTGTYGYTYAPSMYVRQFIDELGKDCYGFLPMDYFGMAVNQPSENYQGLMDSIQSYDTSKVTGIDDSLHGSNTYIYGSNDVGNSSVESVSTGAPMGRTLVTPAMISLAQRALKYVNKNTIVGRSIHDFIRAHYGLSLDTSHDLDTVYIIGESSVNIGVGEVMSQSGTAEAELGEYAGRGRGEGASEKFVFENRNMHGVWITLSCIMPKSGFYQGLLRENQSLSKLDFFTPEFDAVGYQVLTQSEISVDFPVNTRRNNVSDLESTIVKPNNAFGFVPRYSHLKVGRNIVNGDLSLRSMRNDMAPYTLDRMIPYERANFTRKGDKVYYLSDAPNFKIGVVRDEFRKVDPTDHLGNYNRIFYYTKSDVDHFIINNVFSVTGYLPCISLSESFDTFTDEDSVVEIKHS